MAPSSLHATNEHTVNNKVDKFGGLSVEKVLKSTVESDKDLQFKVDVYLYPVVNA